MSLKNLKYIFLISLIFSPLVLSADCSTPVECYTKAIATLKQDRDEMRKQLDQYKTMYDSAVNDNKKLKETIDKLESTMNSKFSEMNQNFQTQIAQAKTYLERPFKSLEKLVYEGTSLSQNLSTIALNGIIPAEARKVLVYVSFFFRRRL